MDATTRNVTVGDQTLTVGALKKPPTNASASEKANVAHMETMISDGDLSDADLQAIAMFDGDAGLSAKDFEMGGMSKFKYDAGFDVSEAGAFFKAAQAKISTQNGNGDITTGAVVTDKSGDLTAGATGKGFQYDKGSLSKEAHATMASLENEGGLITRDNLEGFVGHTLTQDDCKVPSKPGEAGGALYEKLLQGGFTHASAAEFCKTTADNLNAAELLVPTGIKVATGPATVMVPDKSNPIVTSPVTDSQFTAVIENRDHSYGMGANKLTPMLTIPDGMSDEALIAKHEKLEVTISQQVTKPLVAQFTVVNDDGAKELNYAGFHAMVEGSFPGTFSEAESADLLNLMQNCNSQEDLAKITAYLERIPALDEVMGADATGTVPMVLGSSTTGEVNQMALNCGRLDGIAAFTSLVTNPPNDVTYEKKEVPNPKQTFEDPGQAVSLDFTFGTSEIGTTTVNYGADHFK